MRDRDRFRGCLVGGAAGDALGYAVEFLQESQIKKIYGQGGITQYSLMRGIAPFSDDTQMTLFTAVGLIRAGAMDDEDNCVDHINRAYLDWYRTQEERYPLPDTQHAAWLVNVPALFSRRAPGNTCLGALGAGGGGTPERPINNSKGCGGIMRAAPVGLFFNDRGKTPAQICRLGAETAALTHGHSLGWIPSGAFAQIIHEVAQDGASLTDAVDHSLATAEEVWPETEARHTFVRLMRRARDLAHTDTAPLAAIHQLGEGWVAEETLAIAVYCALKFPGDLDSVLITAVNHRGDSDSTGAVAGNLVGAQLGYSAIPEKYTRDLEQLDLLLEVADDLWWGLRDDGDPVWHSKYALGTYAPAEKA